MLVLGLCIGQSKGQLTRHACVGGQSVSCARAVVPHFAESTVFFFMKTYNRCLVSFSNFVIVFIT